MKEKEKREEMKKAKRKTTPAPGKPSRVQVDQIKRAGEENRTRFVFFYDQEGGEAAREGGDKEKEAAREK